MSGAVWLVTLALYLGAGEPAVRLEDGWLRLETVPEILVEEVVRRQLDSGLTTTFVFQVEVVDGGGRKVEGAAQVEVRFEPWDGVYFVTILAPDSGSPGGVGRETRRMESFAALNAWWRRPDLPVLDPSPLAGAGWRVAAEVRVIPFSASEQEDARRWFARSLETPGGSAEEVGRASEAQVDAVGQVLRLLMATSIQRRALVRHRWTVSFSP
jgi:hypothetical protein